LPPQSYKKQFRSPVFKTRQGKDETEKEKDEISSVATILL